MTKQVHEVSLTLKIEANSEQEAQDKTKKWMSNLITEFGVKGLPLDVVDFYLNKVEVTRTIPINKVRTPVEVLNNPPKFAAPPVQSPYKDKPAAKVTTEPFSLATDFNFNQSQKKAVKEEVEKSLTFIRQNMALKIRNINPTYKDGSLNAGELINEIASVIEGKV